MQFPWIGLRRRAGCEARRQVRPGVEALEARALLARVPAAALRALPTVSLFASGGVHQVGDAVTLMAFVTPGTVEERPVQFEFQERFGRNGPWVDIASPSSSDQITFDLPRSGRIQVRALAKVLVDADEANDGDEEPEGFQDLADLSESPISPYVLARQAPFASVDMLLRFTTPTVTLAAAPAIRPPAPEPSDRLTVTANVPIFVTNGNREEYIKPKNPVVFDETLTENQPEGAKLGDGLLMRPAVKISRWRVSVGKDREAKEAKIAAALGTQTPNENVAVLLMKDKEISDIILVENFPGQNIDNLEFSMYSAAKGKPIKIVDPTPENGFPKLPDKRIMVDETGDLQDITEAIFPNYYDKNGKLKLKDFPPPFKVEVKSV